MEMKKIGITGAGGRIGALLATHFVEDSKVRLFTFQSREESKEKLKVLEKHPNCQSIEEVDLSNEEAIKGKFEGLDVVIHMAANGNYDATYEVLKKSNFDSTVNVFDECVRAKVKRIIFASTNHTQQAPVVKSPQNLLEHKPDFKDHMKLSDVPYPDSLYGVSKLFGENLGKLYAWKYGLECICFRIGAFKNFEIEDPKEYINTPPEEHIRTIYLSHEDCVGYHRAALNCEIKNNNGIPFLVTYACSNNSHKIWDMEETFKALNFTPSHNSDKYFER